MPPDPTLIALSPAPPPQLTSARHARHALRPWGRGLLLAGMLASGALRPAQAQTPEAVRAQVAALAATDDVARFYARRAYVPAWVAAGRLRPPAEALLESLRAASTHGLDPAAYRLADLEGLRAQTPLTPEVAAMAEVQLSRAFFAYAHDLLHGRTSPRRFHPGWALPPREADLPAALQANVDGGDVTRLLASLAPATDAYAALRATLARYRVLADTGGWPRLSVGETLQRGDRGPRLIALRARLARVAPLAPSAPDSADAFDAPLDVAVRAFQQQHGLAPDGVVGPATLAALNVPVEARIAQLALNLERLRWLPGDLGDRYMLVNLPAFTLTVIERGATVLRMGLVIGKTSTPTPVFSTHATEVVLAPYWDVPASIARAEVAPRVARDPGYLARNGIRRLPGGGFRQAPGPANPLGRLKFIVSNRFGIGLHDTPSRGLFALPERAYSHGCMRLEQPIELALYALRGSPRGDRAALEGAIGRWKEVRIPLPEPIPLHVLYQTAWVDASGALHVRADLYGHDARLARALALHTATAGRAQTGLAAAVLPGT